jgi:phosphoenolpyruvate carboxykinase (GTP)
VDRLDGRADGALTPIGTVPTQDALDLGGLEIDDKDLEQLLSVDPEVWRREAELIPAHFERFGDHLPGALWAEHRALAARLG